MLQSYSFMACTHPDPPHAKLYKLCFYNVKLMLCSHQKTPGQTKSMRKGKCILIGGEGDGGGPPDLLIMLWMMIGGRTKMMMTMMMGMKVTRFQLGS